MQPKFADSWILVGERTFTPDDESGVIGGLSLSEEDDTIWVRITQLNEPGPWPWSYGILGWQTSQGYELGSIKCFSDSVGEVAKLGVGLRPVDRSGELVFRPRSYNLAWIKNGNPWTLRFEAKVGSSSSGGDVPSFGTRATLGVLTDAAGSLVNYAITDGVARILLPLP